MAGYIADDTRKVTTKIVQQYKTQDRPIVMLTTYDYTFAQLVDRAGVDIILVGDSAANVMAGYTTTLPITLDQMIYHASSVVRGTRRAMVIADMPFGSYQASREEGVRSAVRLMKESGVDGVKIEGGAAVLDTVRAIVEAGIPVMGHLGLTPQSVHQFGGYGLQAKEERDAERLLADALSLQEAGCFSIVVEKVPAALTHRLSQQLSIPVIGIGAGEADGQVLVLQDMLGMNEGFQPKFLRRYADLGATITDAVLRYAGDVRSRAFPSESESY